MPEYVFAALIAATLSAIGVSFKKIDGSDRRMDRLELKIAENYVTKEEVRQQFQELLRILTRLEDKMDKHLDEYRLSDQTTKVKR